MLLPQLQANPRIPKRKLDVIYCLVTNVRLNTSYAIQTNQSRRSNVQSALNRPERYVQYVHISIERLPSVRPNQRAFTRLF